MELMEKRAYKQTEVGLIPDDWNVEAIGNLGSISTGGSDTQDRVDDGFYPFFVRSLTIERINKYSFDGEAILTSGDGVGVGKIFHYVNCKFDYHQRVYNIHNYRSDVCGKYLFFQFSTNFYDRVMAMTAKSSVDSVRREMIVDMKIPLPPTLTEQKAIATVLSDVDVLIANLDKLIVKKKVIKQGTMQQLLTPPHKGGKRLPGFSGEWEEKTLGDIGSFKNGMNKGAEDFGHGYPFVNLMDVFGIPTITSNKHLGLINSNYEEQVMYNLKLGDVLFVRSSVKPSGVGLTSVVLKNLDETVFSGFLIRFRTHGELDPTYKIHCFHQKEFRNKVIAAASSSANTNINQEALKSLVLTFPKNIEEQKAIAQILSDMDIEIDVLEAKKAKYQDIKQGMMQELLTGKTRLV
jgi:type I restriction enzyme S subunit